jgi:hypothetical protein
MRTEVKIIPGKLVRKYQVRRVGHYMLLLLTLAVIIQRSLSSTENRPIELLSFGLDRQLVYCVNLKGQTNFNAKQVDTIARQYTGGMTVPRDLLLRLNQECRPDPKAEELIFKDCRPRACRYDALLIPILISGQQASTKPSSNLPQESK